MSAFQKMVKDRAFYGVIAVRAFQIERREIRRAIHKAKRQGLIIERLEGRLEKKN